MQRKETNWDAAGRALLELQHQEALSSELSKPYALFILEKERLSKVVSLWHNFSPTNNIVINLLTQGGNTYCQQVATEEYNKKRPFLEFSLSIPGLQLVELDSDLDSFVGLSGLSGFRKTREVVKISIASPYLTEKGITRSLSNKGCIYYVLVEFEKFGVWSIAFNRYGQNGAVVNLLAFDGVVPKKGII